MAQVSTDPQTPEQEQTLAEAITSISDSLKKLASHRINEKAVLALIHDDTGIAKRTIKDVLTSLQSLRKKYTR